MEIVCVHKHLWGGSLTIGQMTLLVGETGKIQVDDLTAEYLLEAMSSEFKRPTEIPGKLQGTAFGGAEPELPPSTPTGPKGLPIDSTGRPIPEQKASPAVDTSPPPPPPPQGSVALEPDVLRRSLNKRTEAQLRAEVDENGLSAPKGASKEELINAIVSAATAQQKRARGRPRK